MLLHIGGDYIWFDRCADGWYFLFKLMVLSRIVVNIDLYFAWNDTGASNVNLHFAENGTGTINVNLYLAINDHFIKNVILYLGFKDGEC